MERVGDAMSRQKFLPIPESEGFWDDPTGYYWAGSPACISPTPEEKVIISARAAGRLWFLGGVSDPDPCYSYDEYVIVKVGRVSYLLRTSGCSCPSPEETWHVISKANSTRRLLHVLIKERDKEKEGGREWAYSETDWFIVWAKERMK